MNDEENPIDLIRLSRIRRLIRSGEAREIRESACISRQEIASALGVRVQAIGTWENDGVSPRIPTAMRYLDLLESLQGGTR